MPSPLYSIRATYGDNGDQQMIVDEWEYLKALVRHFLDKNDRKKATHANDVVLTLRGLPPEAVVHERNRYNSSKKKTSGGEGDEATWAKTP